MRTRPLVLIVDDEENFLEIMSTRLNAAGFETVLARNEKEAVAQAEKLMPDLILMDILMPGATGTDAALAIKQNPATQNIKIAFLTNLREPWPAFGDHKKVAKELGMEDFLEKTEDPASLVEKIKQILAK